MGSEAKVTGAAGRIPWPDGPAGYWVYAIPVSIPGGGDQTFYVVRRPSGDSLTYSAEAVTQEFAQWPMVPSGNMSGDAILDTARECADSLG